MRAGREVGAELRFCDLPAGETLGEAPTAGYGPHPDPLPEGEGLLHYDEPWRVAR